HPGSSKPWLWPGNAAVVRCRTAAPIRLQRPGELEGCAMTATTDSPLVPTPSLVADPINTALARLKDDPGALFEPDILAPLREVRSSDPARWARIRHHAKEARTVSLAELDSLTSQADALHTHHESAIFPEVTLWPDPVDGASLLDELAHNIKRHVIADPATLH